MYEISTFTLDSIVTTTPFEPLKIWLWPPLPQGGKLYDQLETYIYNSTKFHEILSSSSWDLPWTSSWSAERKEKENNNNNNNNNKKKRSKSNKSPKLCLGDLIICLCTINIGSALFNSVFSNTIIIYSNVCYIYNERPSSSQNVHWLYIYIYTYYIPQEWHFIFNSCVICMFK